MNELKIDSSSVTNAKQGTVPLPDVYNAAFEVIRKISDLVLQELEKLCDSEPEVVSLADAIESILANDHRSSAAGGPSQLNSADRRVSLSAKDVILLREFANYLVSLGSREEFRNDPLYFEYLISEEAQGRFERLWESDPLRTQAADDRIVSRGYSLVARSDAEVLSRRELLLAQAHDESADANGTTGLWVDGSPAFVVYERLMKMGPEQLTLSQVSLHRGRGSEDSDGKLDGRYLIPEARADEILMEILSATWIALFFCGERYDVLSSIVERIETLHARGLPAGCCVYKAYGDVYRETRQSLLRVADSSGMLPENCPRLRTVARYPVLFGENDFYADKLIDRDLTPSCFRALGAMYLYWMAMLYLRDGLPFMAVMPLENFVERVRDSGDFGNGTARTWSRWVRLAFGISESTCGQYDRVRGIGRHAAHATAFYAVKNEKLMSLDLQRGCVGIRRGAISGGMDLFGVALQHELPFTGRRIFGDLLSTYSWGYRELGLYSASNYDEVTANLFRTDGNTMESRTALLRSYVQAQTDEGSRPDEVDFAGVEALNIFDFVCKGTLAKRKPIPFAVATEEGGLDAMI